MRILGISCFYHESAAALLIDGKIMAAAAEERFTRTKHDASFPRHAIDFCLTFGRPDLVVFYEKPFLKFSRHLTISASYFPKSLGYFVESMRNSLTEKLWIKSIIAKRLKIDQSKILFVPHHLSHAAASFYPSPFEQAAYLTLDGVGDWSTGSWGVVNGNKIYPKMELRFPHSVGLLYSSFTAFLGFEVNDGEYKVMGMAGYGKPKYIDKIKKLFRQYKDGGISLNLDYFSFHTTARRMYSDQFVKEFSGLNRFDLAASLQKVTEEIVLNMMTAIATKTNEKNLVYGGGVALNSVINGLITKKTPFKNVFIYPAAGDDGGAVGAALYIYHHVLENKRRYSLRNVFLGKQWNNEAIKQFLMKRKITYRRMDDKKLLDFVSDALTGGKVVGWFEGRAEYGPRALGHRSILADPKDAKMKDIVNKKIKFREEFRPFAPAVLEESAPQCYLQGVALQSRYMLATYRAGNEAKRIASATVHIDGTSRIQTVPKEFDGRLRKLLETFYRKTGRPILLNTSFNLKGEPIVNSPHDAYNTFIKSGLDVLVLENYVVVKNKNHN